MGPSERAQFDLPAGPRIMVNLLAARPGNGACRVQSPCRAVPPTVEAWGRREQLGNTPGQPSSRRLDKSLRFLLRDSTPDGRSPRLRSAGVISAFAHRELRSREPPASTSPSFHGVDGETFPDSGCCGVRRGPTTAGAGRSSSAAGVPVRVGRDPSGPC